MQEEGVEIGTLQRDRASFIPCHFVSLSPQNVINQFHTLASDGKCNFIGNIDVGSTVTVQSLKEKYHAVVLVSASCDLTIVSIPHRCPSGTHSIYIRTTV